MSVGGGVLGATSPEVSSGDGGSGDWLHIYGRVEAMLPRVEALAADRTQRESSLHVRLLQAEASRRRWKTAYIELPLLANPKIIELQEKDSEDSRNCHALFDVDYSGPEMRPKRARRHVEPSENAMDYEDVTRDLRAELENLRQAYETLSTNRDKEATEAAQKLQQTIEELQVAVQKKDDEIGRLRAEAVEPKNKEKATALVATTFEPVAPLSTQQLMDSNKSMVNKIVEALELKKKAVEEVIAKLKKSLAAEQQQVHLLKEQLSTAKSTNQAKLETIEKDYAKLKKSLAAEQQQVQLLKDQLSTAKSNQGKLETIEEDYAKLKKSLAAEQQQVQLLKEQLSTAKSNQAKLETIEEDYAKLKKLLAAEQQQVQLLKEQLSTAKSANQAKLETIEKDYAKLKKSLAAEQKKVQLLKEQLSTAKSLKQAKIAEMEKRLQGSVPIAVVVEKLAEMEAVMEAELEARKKKNMKSLEQHQQRLVKQFKAAIREIVGTGEEVVQTSPEDRLRQAVDVVQQMKPAAEKICKVVVEAPVVIDDWRLSAARQGAAAAFTLLLAHHPDANLAMISSGVPGRKDGDEMEMEPLTVGYACRVTKYIDLDDFVPEHPIPEA